MDTQTIILLFSLIYFVAMIAIGVWANTRMKSSKDFLVAGQSLGFFVMAIASFSSIQSGWGMVGTTGTVSSWGVGVLVTVSVLPVGFAAAWFLLGRKLRRLSVIHDVYSIPDIVRVRYKSRGAHLGMTIAVILGAIGYMTSQVVAAGIIMSLLLGIPLLIATCIGALIVAAYTVAGGMLAAMWTDLIQGLVMIGMSVGIFFIALASGGGWGNIVNTLRSEDVNLLSLDGVQPAVWIVANAIMYFLGIIGQPQLVHKFLMLKSSKELKWGAMVAGIGYAATTLFSIGIGLAMRSAIIEGRVEMPTVLDDTATSFLSNFTSPVIAGLALVALLAAIMSSASSFITIGASALMRDLAASFGFRLNRELLWNRVGSVIIVGAALSIGLYLDQIIYLLGAIGWAAFAAAIFGPIVLGIYWRRGTGLAATMSIFAGLGLNIFLTLATSNGWIALPAYFFSSTAVICVGILVYIVVSFASRSTEDEARFDSLFDENVGHKKIAPSYSQVLLEPEGNQPQGDSK